MFKGFEAMNAGFRMGKGMLPARGCITHIGEGGMLHGLRGGRFDTLKLH